MSERWSRRHGRQRENRAGHRMPTLASVTIGLVVLVAGVTGGFDPESEGLADVTSDGGVPPQATLRASVTAADAVTTGPSRSTTDQSATDTSGSRSVVGEPSSQRTNAAEAPPSAAGSGQPVDVPRSPRCSHPHPCGDEWPDGLEGPFDLAEVKYVTVESFDGTPLEGWIGLPEVPPGVQVPVALHVTPYLGACGGIVAFAEPCYANPDEPTWWEDPAHVDGWYAWKIDPIEFVRRGYAVAYFSVRGTANSGGCFSDGGMDEQRDQVVITEWLTEQPWSNGRIGMGGVSYPSQTALAAAVQAPEALKTVVVSGLVSDLYTLLATPQGAVATPASVFTPLYAAGISLVPAWGSGTARTEPARLPARACRDLVAATAVAPSSQFSDRRPGAYFDERRSIDGLPDVTASVLLAQGFLDNLAHGSGHGFQDDAAWHALTQAPKRQLAGQWGHTFPHAEAARLDPRWRSDEWSEVVFAWLDYWLKGIGDPERLGFVDYQDSAGTWHQSRNWPPQQAREQVLYFAGESLTDAPDGTVRGFRTAPDVRNTYTAASNASVPLQMWSALCGGPAAVTGVAYVGEPLERDAVIAGNPFAYLRLSSDLPGGIVGVHLVELTSDFACDADGQVRGVEVLSMGAADLRFHDGNFAGRDFPVATPTNVRVDLFDLAEHLPAGHRLAVVVSGGDGVFYEWSGQPYHPDVGVHGDGGVLASHVVLPVVEGTVGGARPTVSYPPRPFVPGTSTGSGPRP